MAKKRRTTAPVRGFLRSTRAVSALEYAILVGVVVVAVAGALGAFSTEIVKALDEVKDKIMDTVTPSTPSTP